MRGMSDNIAKTRSKTLVIPTGWTIDCMALKFFPETILVLKVDCCEGILNQNKIDRMVYDHSSTVTCSYLKNLHKSSTVLISIIITG